MRAFELPDESSVLHIPRVRFGDDVPLCVEHATLPAERFPGLLGHDLLASLYGILRVKYGVEVTWTRSEVEAATTPPDAARHLGISSRTLPAHPRPGRRRHRTHHLAVPRRLLHADAGSRTTSLTPANQPQWFTSVPISPK
ncbi:GntR family transcriptional regulator [Cryptosporangium arvum]|uniref:UTRA domain-containing protein n=1 Tax=Cryptosporangium arvum TaxID=80871 RepID=UPI00147033A8